RGPNQPPPSIDMTYPHGGQVSVLEKGAVMLKRQPTDPALVLPDKTFRVKPGRALPGGALVVRQPANDAEAAQTQAKVTDPTLNPWIFVEVVSSPLQPQKGWRGWLHSEALEPSNSSAKAPSRVLNAHSNLLKKTSPLCDRPSLQNANCRIEVDPSLLMRHVRCEGDFIEVEIWDPEGIYLSGFVMRDNFAEDPCQIKR
ncbi:MAG: hypothetical protein AAFS10_16355, partial [Myxococcota bacterium]